MAPQEQALLDQHLVDTADETIRRKIVDKYNNYYRHWWDLNLVIALFATTSLVLAILQWEDTFNYRGPDGRDVSGVGYFTQFIVFVISLNGAGAIILKYYFESVWQNYQKPVAFYKSIVK